jgi:hypothetical protein
MFEGKGRPLTEAGMTEAGATLDVGLPALWAVMTVETKGCGFLRDRRPLILFERHVFHRLTNGRFANDVPDLSSPARGGYGAAGANQYERLERALELDRRAALESCSWGLGQVMGFNSAKVGFADVEAMVGAMLNSEDEQFQAMVGFIRAFNLSRYLAQGDWTNFAFHYNGSDFQKNKYDTKLARAHARYVTGPLPSLRTRAAQLYLGYLGFDPGGVDGWYGPGSQRAVTRFQKSRNLPQSGALDDATFAALEAEAMR